MWLVIGLRMTKCVVCILCIFVFFYIWSQVVCPCLCFTCFCVFFCIFVSGILWLCYFQFCHVFYVFSCFSPQKTIPLFSFLPPSSFFVRPRNDARTRKCIILQPFPKKRLLNENLIPTSFHSFCHHFKLRRAENDQKRHSRLIPLAQPNLTSGCKRNLQTLGQAPAGPKGRIEIGVK